MGAPTWVQLDDTYINIEQVSHVDVHRATVEGVPPVVAIFFAGLSVGDAIHLADDQAQRFLGFLENELNVLVIP
jgi:hypothetical protein